MENEHNILNKLGSIIKQRSVLVLVGAIILGVGSFVALGQKGAPANEENSTQTAYVPEFEEEQTKQVVEEGVTTGIKIPGYSSIIVSANTADVAVDLQNPEENNVYFKITLTLTDTEEKIYESKLIKPGQHLYEITLSRPLDAGEYNLTITYDTFSMDETYTPKNGASVNCILKAI